MRIRERQKGDVVHDTDAGGPTVLMCDEKAVPVGRQLEEADTANYRERRRLAEATAAQQPAIVMLYRAMTAGHLLQLQRAYRTERDQAVNAETAAFCRGRLTLIDTVLAERAGRMARFRPLEPETTGLRGHDAHRPASLRIARGRSAPRPAD